MKNMQLFFKNDHLIVETFCGKSADTQKFRSYFLYASKPTSWRDNWRRIRGFYICVFGYYLIMAAWQ